MSRRMGKGPSYGSYGGRAVISSIMIRSWRVAFCPSIETTSIRIVTGPGRKPPKKLALRKLGSVSVQGSTLY